MKELTPTIHQAVILDVARLACEKYIIPKKGLETAQFIQLQMEEGCYGDVINLHEFADRLTADLRKASNDHHWSVSYDSTLTRAIYAEDESESDTELLKEHLRRANFGVEKIEHLLGNIGYVDVREFSWIGFPGAGETVVAAMQLVSHCDALIFDMRHNHGGEVETLQLYISYFTTSTPKLYDSFYYRPTNETQQLWTMPYVPGSRMPDVPLFILTSGVTGSGGEAFAYILKSMERATIVGEATLGAAHTTDMEIVQEYFQVEFPSGRSISPFTKSDWEGSGVQPDIATPPEEALEVAHLQSLVLLMERCSNEQRKRELDWDLEIARITYAPIAIDELVLALYVGQYGDRTFVLEGGALTYSRQGSAGLKLIPLAENRFVYPNEIKIEFCLGEKERPNSVMISYRNGRPAITIAQAS